MLSKLALLCLIAVSAAAPLTERQQIIKKVWGEDVNVTLTESIIADEAKRFGVSTDEYFNTCTADADSFNLTPEEKTAIESERETLESTEFKVENRDQLLTALRDRAPKTYEAVMKRGIVIDQYIAKLDVSAQKFARNVKNSILDVFVIGAKAKNSGDIGMEPLMKIGELAKKLYKEYRALPQSAKDSLDKTFCINATIRIVKSQIEQYLTAMFSNFSTQIEQYFTEMYSYFSMSVAAAPLTPRQQIIKKVWGDDVNVTLAESIIADDAKRFGVSTDEYFNTCTADADSFEFTPEEKTAMENEKAALNATGLKFNNIDQLLTLLRDRAPNTYEAVMKRGIIIDQYIAKLDGDAQKFAKDVKNSIVDTLVSIVKTQEDMRMEQLMNIGAAVKKIYTDYRALPQSAKDSLDKTFCINATIRIVKSQIEQYFTAMLSKVSLTLSL